MGFFSSLFGSSKSAPATTTNVISQKLPSEIAPYATEVLTEAQDLYTAQKERGYDPYTGETIAPLTPEQQQAMTGIAGLVGTSQPLQQEALDTFRQGGEQFTGDIAQQYMSPYQQAVTDIELREAQNKFDTQTMPQFEAAAVGAGGMSGLGSRAGVQAAELQRGQSQLLADIQAKGTQGAYKDAQKAFEDQKAREQQMGTDVSRTGPAMFASGLQEQGALQGVGEQKQQLGQSALDEAYYKFLEEQQYPQQQLANYSGFVYGNPAAGMVNQTATGTSTPYQPSFGQTILGLGSGLASSFLGSSGGSAAVAKKLFNKEGGKVSDGLSGLVRREEGGGLGEDEDGFPIDSPENIAQFTEETSEVMAPSVAPAPDRAAIFRDLASKAGPFGSMQTPDEIKEASAKKKANRAAVREQITGLMGSGNLTVGKFMLALGSAIGKGGGVEISKSLEAMTNQLMKERKDLSKVQAEALLSNLEIDELTDEMIRKLPSQMQKVLAARKESKGKEDLRKAREGELKRRGGPKSSTRLPVDLSKRPDLINQGDRILKRKTAELLKGKNLSGAEIDFANRLGDLDNESQQNFFARVYEINRLAGDGDLEKAVDQALKEAYDRMKKMGPDPGLDERDFFLWD